MRSIKTVGRVIITGVVVAWTLVFGAALAFAQYPGGGETPPNVKGEKFFRGGDRLSRTGTDIRLWILFACLAVAAGLLIRYLSRRSSSGDAGI